MHNEGDKFLEWTKTRQEPLYIPSFVYCGVIAKTKTNWYESTRCHLTHRKGTDAWRGAFNISKSLSRPRI